MPIPSPGHNLVPHLRFELRLLQGLSLYPLPVGIEGEMRVASALFSIPTIIDLVEKEGIGPSTAECKTAVIPFNYIPKLVAAAGVEPTVLAYEASVLPLHYSAILVVPIGFEPI